MATRASSRSSDLRAREKIWVVRPADGKTVGEVLRRAGPRLVAASDVDDAIRAGRVFVGRRRVLRDDEKVNVGDTIRLGALDERVRSPEITILFEKDDLAFCLKPAGLSTVPDHAGARSLVTLAADALGTKTANLRVTSRLDHDVSGVVVFALSAEAEQRLRNARAEGSYRRRYIAIAQGETGASGVWTTPIGRAANPRLRVAVPSSPGPFAPVDADATEHQAKPAATRFARVATVSPGSEHEAVTMLAVDPVTGRTHQIRVHAASAGAALIGDRDYGGASRLTLNTGRVIALDRIALHAARIVVPGRAGPIEGRAPIPPELLGLWAALGGQSEAWDRALSCDTPPFLLPPSS